MNDEQMPAWAKAMEDRLAGKVGTLTGGMSTLTGDVSKLTGNVSTLTGNVSTLTGNVSTLTGNVSTLTGNVSKLTDDVSKLADAIAKMDERNTARAEAMEHRLILEISQGIATSEDRTAARIAELRAEMTRRFDQVHDDLTVNLARADLAVERVQRLEGDVRKELSQLQRRLRELENWRDRHPELGP